MTSKTDKVGEVLDHQMAKLIRILRIEPNVENAIIESDILIQEARHALLEAIKAELPKRKHPLCNYSHPPGQEMCVECYSGCEQDYNQALTEVNAILERLFKC